MGFPLAMTDKLSDADVRRARSLCAVAAVVFLACGVLLAVLPLGLSGVVRGVLAGFHAVVGLAVWLYGRQLGGES